jgi:hypothetical protein
MTECKRKWNIQMLPATEEDKKARRVRATVTIQPDFRHADWQGYAQRFLVAAQQPGFTYNPGPQPATVPPAHVLPPSMQTYNTPTPKKHTDAKGCTYTDGVFDWENVERLCAQDPNNAWCGRIVLSYREHISVRYGLNAQFFTADTMYDADLNDRRQDAYQWLEQRISKRQPEPVTRLGINENARVQCSKSVHHGFHPANEKCPYCG